MGVIMDFGDFGGHAAVVEENVQLFLSFMMNEQFQKILEEKLKENNANTFVKLLNELGPALKATVECINEWKAQQ